LSLCQRPLFARDAAHTAMTDATERDAKATALLRARTSKELDDIRLDLCATEARLERERHNLANVERCIEWDRVCVQLGVRSESEAELRNREVILRNQRKQWEVRSTAAQHVRVRLEAEQNWRALLYVRDGVRAAFALLQRGGRSLSHEDTARLAGGAIRDFFARCRNTELQMDEKTAAPALHFTPRRTSAEEPPSSFRLTVTVAANGQVQAADEQGLYRHFNLLQDHPSEWFVR